MTVKQPKPGESQEEFVTRLAAEDTAEKEADARAEARHAEKLAREAAARALTEEEDRAAEARRLQREKDAISKKRFYIEYTQGEEAIKLSFYTADRRDTEYARLLATGVKGMERTEGDAE